MKILIADDHWIVRDSIKHVFQRVQVEFEPCEATTFEESLTILEANSDIALMVIDLIMPGFNEFAGLANLRRSFPNIPIVVLSVHEDREYVLKSIEHGVVGYIPKSTAGSEMMHAFERVLSGDVYFPRHILSQTQPSTTQRRLPSVGAEPSATTDEQTDVDSLTARERDIVQLLGEGLSDAKIAKSLELSPNTIRVHVRNVMKKLGLSDRAQAIHFAVKLAASMKKPATG